MVIHLFHSTVVSGPEKLALPALPQLGEEVQIVFLYETRAGSKADGPVEYARSLGFTVHSVPVRSRLDRQAFRELRVLLDRLSPRIVHAHDVKASVYLLGAKRSAPGFQPRMVSTHHGAMARWGLIRLYEEYYVRFVLPHFDAVCAVSSWDRESLLSRGIQEKKLHVHINGSDRSLVPAADRSRIQKEIRERWREQEPGLPDPETGIYLGAVARLSPEKCHDRMLRSLRTVLKLRPGLPVALLCFGGGEEEARLRRLTQEWGLERHVFWMGYSDTISEEMAGFDLLLCLSSGEGIPINLIEAGWAGTPVLSTSVGGIPDLIPNEEVGYLVDPGLPDGMIGRRLLTILQDPQGRGQTGAAYQRHVQAHHSQESWLEQLREVYRKVSVS